MGDLQFVPKDMPTTVNVDTSLEKGMSSGSSGPIEGGAINSAGGSANTGVNDSGSMPSGAGSVQFTGGMDK